MSGWDYGGVRSPVSFMWFCMAGDAL